MGIGLILLETHSVYSDDGSSMPDLLAEMPKSLGRKYLPSGASGSYRTFHSMLGRPVVEAGVAGALGGVLSQGSKPNISGAKCLPSDTRPL